MAKDFSKVNTNPVYNAIADATAEPEQLPGQTTWETIQEAQEPQEAQEKQTGRKPRRTYSEQETQEALYSRQTSGKKGVKLPRINLAFTPDVYEYIQIMSRVRGESMTDFINLALRQHREQHADIYEKAIEFRNSL